MGYGDGIKDVRKRREKCLSLRRHAKIKLILADGYSIRIIKFSPNCNLDQFLSVILSQQKLESPFV